MFLLSRVNVASAVNILSSTSTSFGGAQQIDEKLQKQLLAEEENAMKQFKVSTLVSTSTSFWNSVNLKMTFFMMMLRKLRE